MDKEHRTSLLKLHFVVFIYGFTAILGKLISISAIDLVWYRMLVAVAGLSVLLFLQGFNLKISFRAGIQILLVGLIVAAHWISFFGAIKLSNISVTLGCLASTTLFTSILEPLILKRKVNAVEVIIGLIIIAGLYLIFQFEIHYLDGILVALASAFLAGLFTVLNKKLVQKHSTRLITFYEMVGGFIGISLFFLFTEGFSTEFFLLPVSDVFYLLLLGLVCTAFAFAIQVDVMKKLSAYLVALTINLEPVYGIILAWLFFRDTELMSTGFYIGTVIILVAVLAFPVYQSRRRKAEVLQKKP
ncbi:MAG: DMT family transporter [Bacteroidota bacterium]|nr:MAG: DMT family transporter [Bacteroidota bacterium]